MSPFEVLGLNAEASPEEVTRRWRELASEHHPDRGGDPEAFRLCREAYEAALPLAQEPKLCSECGGAGKTSVVRGFNQVTVTCQVCRGSGTK
jgi:DnaJ-class molecular chaperone